MKRTLLALGVAAAILGGCNSNSSLPYAGTSTPTPVPTISILPTATPTATSTATATATPTPVPSSTATAVGFSASFVNVPFFATPYPNPATNIAFPGTGTPFAVTLQLNGGTPPYTATVSSACGNFAASAVSVSAVSGSSTQFVIIPTQAGGACTLSFSDKSTPTNTTSLTVTVNGGASGTVT